MTEADSTPTLTRLAAGHNRCCQRMTLCTLGFGLGITTGLGLAEGLIGAVTACGGGQAGQAHQTTVGPTQQKGIQIAEQITSGERIDRMFITDHLYSNGPDGKTFESSIVKNGKANTWRPLGKSLRK